MSKIVHKGPNAFAVEDDDASPAQFVKDDAGKPRMDLLSGRALLALGDVLSHGAKKYGPGNWRLGSRERYIAAAMRHLCEMLDGKTTDEETGLPHSVHLMACAMFMADMDQEQR